jgi:copper resistance protein B
MILFTLALAAAAPAASAPPASNCTPEHAAMGHCTMAPPVEDPPQPDPCTPEHAAMGHCTPRAAPAPTPTGASGTDLPAGHATAPPAPRVDAADHHYDAAAMAASRAQLYAEHGGGHFSQILVDLAEIRVQNGKDQAVWEARGWFGGDIDRLVVKASGEAVIGGALDSLELQALWSHAIGPYFDVQAGIRHDIEPDPSRSYAVLGIEGLAPYWFDVEAALFLSNKGDITARLAGSYDQRITQRLILQPRAELDLALQDVPELGIGGGASNAELGLRLRYEVVREFAPYVGVAWERKLGGTANYARLAGEDRSRLSLVAGLRFWF